MTDVQKLLEGLRLVGEMITPEVLEKASKEELLEYTSLINKIKARLDSII